MIWGFADMSAQAVVQGVGPRCNLPVSLAASPRAAHRKISVPAMTWLMLVPALKQAVHG